MEVQQTLMKWTMQKTKTKQQQRLEKGRMKKTETELQWTKTKIKKPTKKQKLPHGAPRACQNKKNK